MDPRPIDATDASPDIDLVLRIQAGDSSAEALLFERYGARLYYLALSRTGSPQDAEDLRSETLLRVLSAIRNHQLRAPAALARFILRTLDNVALEMMRRDSQASRLAADPRANAERHFLDDRVKDAIEWTLARLKPREREFLRMYYYDELSKEEIARRIGIAEERVRLLKSRALKSFRERFLRSWRKDSDTSGGG
ncbi:MAG TPA: sigma-70 family RNA polymerase sigma factor [Bryobacteraceae bacterium]|jgi:RNA polymerase sigma-70 factor (ECF subfamily)|nr:sigma-70 family RNA polymerase sigma factor [Bryobacteraceae bacterium]